MTSRPARPKTNAQRGIHSETVDIHRITGMTEFATDCKVAI